MPGSRIRVTYTGTALTGTNAFRFTNTTVTVTPPTIPAACELQNYANPSEGRLTFGDDFNGTSMDPTKWRVRDGESLSFNNAPILARDVTVHDVLLDIAGKREDAPRAGSGPPATSTASASSRRGTGAGRSARRSRPTPP